MCHVCSLICDFLSLVKFIILLFLFCLQLLYGEIKMRIVHLVSLRRGHENSNIRIIYIFVRQKRQRQQIESKNKTTIGT